MNVVVFSDSHGRVRYIEQMMARVSAGGGEPPSYVLFLGDGLADLGRTNALLDECVVEVRGNCDVLNSADVPDVRVMGLGGYSALLLHGHTQGVKLGLANAIACAVRSEADLLLFGHTHEPYAEVLTAGTTYMGIRIPKTLYVMNPGSLSLGSFGRIVLNNKGILMSFGNLFDT